MNLLLDTHALIWCALDPEQLSLAAREAILSPDNQVFVSPVSLWEISLKYTLGKLKLSGITPDAFPRVCSEMGFSELSMSSKECVTFYKLPRLEHRDPFDRMLIWQAIQQDLQFVSCDRAMEAYRELGLHLVW